MTQNVEQYADLANAFHMQGQYCIDHSHAPFNGTVLHYLADALQQSADNSQLQQHLHDIVQPWKDYTLEQMRDDAVALRFVGALHHLALNKVDNQLSSVYPSTASDRDTKASDADIHATVAAAVIKHSEQIKEFVQHEPQTNEVNRAATLLVGFLYIAHRFPDLPFSCYELGASAGLNTLWYKYGYTVDTQDNDKNVKQIKLGDTKSPVQTQAEWRTPLPASLASARLPLDRVTVKACDRSPVDINDPDAVLRLQAFVWPDQMDRLQRLTAAIKTGQQNKVRVEKADAADWVEQNVKTQNNTVSIVYHTVVYQYIPADSQQRIEQHMQKVGSTATRTSPLIWLTMEHAQHGEKTVGKATLFEVIVRVWDGSQADNKPEKIVVAKCHPHGMWIECQQIAD